MTAQTIPLTSADPLRSLPPAGEIIVRGGAYTVAGLVRENKEEADVLARLSAVERIETLNRWIAFGATLDGRATAVADADYMAKETQRLLETFRSTMDREIRVRFDPASEGSLTRPMVEEARDSKRVLAEAQKHLAELVRVNFDPNDARSAVAKIAVLLRGLEASFETSFDPKRKDSIWGKFDERTEALVKRMTGPDGPLQGVVRELQALRAEVCRADSAKAAKAAVIERSSVKGGLFEDDLEGRLISLARAHGDVVERTGTKPGPGGSKRGDFVVRLAAKQGSLVIEAKSGAINSLPKLLKEMDEAKATRSADLVMTVVRDADQLPEQARPFQYYEEGIVVCAENLDFAFRIARWVVSVQNRAVPDAVDSAVAREAAADIIAGLRRLRPTRQQLSVIEKAAENMRDYLAEMEHEIIEAAKRIEDNLES